MKQTKMKAKNMVGLLATLAIALFLVGTVNAGEITNNYLVEVEGMNAYTNTISVIAGETITVKVYFESLVDDTDVTVEAELEGEKVEANSQTSAFDVETGNSYRSVLTIEVPYELKDQLSDDLTLSIELDGKEHKTVLPEVTLKVQRPSYNAVIKSLTTPSFVEAGEEFEIEFVLKNMGYNDLDDVYAEISIPELGIKEGPKWIGDLAKLEDCDDDDDDDCDKDNDLAGKMTLSIPYDVEEGVYEVEFTVFNDDTESTKVKQIVVKNDLSDEVIATTTKKSVAIGEETEFSLILVNPTDKLRIYTIAIDSVVGLSTDVSEAVVAVPAGSSKTVTITAKATSAGVHEFTANVISGNELVESVNYEVEAQGKTTNSIVALTIVLAIIFLVLLVVLIVLLAKRPEKKEDFSESYY